MSVRTLKRNSRGNKLQKTCQASAPKVTVELKAVTDRALCSHKFVLYSRIIMQEKTMDSNNKGDHLI